MFSVWFYFSLFLPVFVQHLVWISTLQLMKFGYLFCCVLMIIVIIIIIILSQPYTFTVYRNPKTTTNKSRKMRRCMPHGSSGYSQHYTCLILKLAACSPLYLYPIRKPDTSPPVNFASCKFLLLTTSPPVLWQPLTSPPYNFASCTLPTVNFASSQLRLSSITLFDVQQEMEQIGS